MKKENKATVSNPNEMNIAQRVKAPTPKFFKTLRTIGLALAAIGGAFWVAPVAVSAAQITVAGYVTLAGSVITAVDTSQAKMTENETP